MNWAVEPEEAARRNRVRIKLFTMMLVTYGYAVLAGSLWEPFTSGAFGSANFAMAAFGMAMHALALYIAPRGEP